MKNQKLIYKNIHPILCDESIFINASDIIRLTNLPKQTISRLLKGSISAISLSPMSPTKIQYFYVVCQDGRHANLSIIT